MAWPCISRACCLARFWSQLDQADIAVPLIFTSYTDACEPRAQPSLSAAPAVETQPSAQEVAPRKSGAPVQASVMRQDFKAWKVRREPSCKPKHEYHEPEVPLDTETQYQKDYKPWPLPRRDHPWIPKASRAEPDGGVEKGQIADRVQEKEILSRRMVEDGAVIDKGGRAVADALNRQIKGEVTDGSSYRTEFKPYADIKPARAIRARSQYQPPDEKTSLETSYSATYRGEQAKLQPADNKALERRRVRTLYSEPHPEASRVDRSSLPRSKPKKTPTPVPSHGKPVKKSKEKQASSSARGTKKSSEKQRPSGKEKSKEMNNKLAEAKEVMLKQQHYIQLCQPIRDIGWVQTLKQHLWRCAMPDPRESEYAGGRVSDFYSSGTSGAEQNPQETRSRAVVRFAPDVKY